MKRTSMVVLAIMRVVSSWAAGQETTGTITGQVVDALGFAMASVTCQERRPSRKSPQAARSVRLQPDFLRFA